MWMISSEEVDSKIPPTPFAKGEQVNPGVSPLLERGAGGISFYI
jgi:hypothetical protein